MLTTTASDATRITLYVAWILAAGVVGLLVTTIFAGGLEWPRSQFLVPLVIVESALLYAYIAWSGIDVQTALAHRWTWGLVLGIAAGLFLVRNVLGQPGSARPEGVGLIGHLLWEGVAYGTIDALLLTVLPVHATWQIVAALGWLQTWPGKIGAGLLALIASGIVTALYHVGYPEFRNADLILTVVGNTIISLAYLLSGSPVAPVVAHVMMHLTAVWHGAATTLQLPPHY